MSWRKDTRARLAGGRCGKQALALRDHAWFVKEIIAGHDHWPGMRDPFGGQRDRLRTIRALIDGFEPDAFIETGTFIGSTTRFFCGNGVPVYTAEVRRDLWLLARLRLGWNSDATVICGDSRVMLRELAEAHSFRRPFFYLDAHWGSNWPLRDELALVCDHWQDAIIVADDFRVDGDDGYGYDQWLSLDDVRLPAGVSAAFPGTPSQAETGARRGTIYLASGAAGSEIVERLVERRLLRRAAREPIAR